MRQHSSNPENETWMIERRRLGDQGRFDWYMYLWSANREEAEHYYRRTLLMCMQGHEIRLVAPDGEVVTANSDTERATCCEERATTLEPPATPG